MIDQRYRQKRNPIRIPGNAPGGVYRKCCAVMLDAPVTSFVSWLRLHTHQFDSKIHVRLQEMPRLQMCRPHGALLKDTVLTPLRQTAKNCVCPPSQADPLSDGLPDHAECAPIFCEICFWRSVWGSRWFSFSLPHLHRTEKTCQTPSQGV